MEATYGEQLPFWWETVHCCRRSKANPTRGSVKYKVNPNRIQLFKCLEKKLVQQRKTYVNEDQMNNKENRVHNIYEMDRIHTCAKFLKYKLFQWPKVPISCRVNMQTSSGDLSRFFVVVVGVIIIIFICSTQKK